MFFEANAGREALFFDWQNLLLHGLGVSNISIRVPGEEMAKLAVRAVG